MIHNDESFGFVKCSLHVPKNLIIFFTNFPPIFKNTEILLGDIGEHMRKYCENVGRKVCSKKSLISSMKGQNIIILSKLFKKYIQMGLKVDDIDYVIEFSPKPCFKWFRDKVSNDRRLADLNPLHAARGETQKEKGNNGYGRTLMDVFKHTSNIFVEPKNLYRHLNNPRFKGLEELNGGIIQVEKKKKVVKQDLPLQIGLAVYSYAKLVLLNFWEFIYDFLDENLYDLHLIDTDSFYFSFARETIDECVKKTKLEQWKIEKTNWFVTEDQTLIDFDDTKITKAQYQKREPGLFKLEFKGLGLLALNSKVYHVYSDTCDKSCCKGVQQKRNTIGRSHFLKVLQTQQPIMFENAGFLMDGTNIRTYTQIKNGLTYCYFKRKVLSDGVRTTHLDI